jgi:hypothetical protein
LKTPLHSGESSLNFDYVGGFETEFENILGYESGRQVGLIDGEKTRDRKSHAAVSLKGKF